VQPNIARLPSDLLANCSLTTTCCHAGRFDVEAIAERGHLS